MYMFFCQHDVLYYVNTIALSVCVCSRCHTCTLWLFCSHVSCLCLRFGAQSGCIGFHQTWLHRVDRRVIRRVVVPRFGKERNKFNGGRCLGNSRRGNFNFDHCSNLYLRWCGTFPKERSMFLIIVYWKRYYPANMQI